MVLWIGFDGLCSSSLDWFVIVEASDIAFNDWWTFSLKESDALLSPTTGCFKSLVLDDADDVAGPVDADLDLCSVVGFSLLKNCTGS